MGFTHYFTQNRSFTVAEFKTVQNDVQQILKYAQHEAGVPLANGAGEPSTSPDVNSKFVSFNGVGDGAHETFIFNRVKATKPKYAGDNNPNWDFCKTARKAYDDVVVAVLCYLTTTTRTFVAGEPVYGSEVFTASSDGHGKDFMVGLDLARKALPHLANVLDIPLDVMKSDRWCGPWVHNESSIEVRFCVDGRGYVLRGKESYCFDSHFELASWLTKHQVAIFKSGGSTNWGSYGKEEPNIWSATGSFEKARHDRIALAQFKVLSTLFPVPQDHDRKPPLFVRPGEMSEDSGREFCYSLSELMNKMEVA
jgi:hypothetical protein